MKILKFNESIRDQMKPKRSEDIKKSLLKLTPYGMLDKIQGNDMDDVPGFVELAEKRVEESLTELDNIIEISTDKQLTELVDNVGKWVKKNGGNEENVTGYGFKELSGQIIHGGVSSGHHDEVIIYDDEVFESFIDLLKKFAICEVQHNNRDYDY